MVHVERFFFGWFFGVHIYSTQGRSHCVPWSGARPIIVFAFGECVVLHVNAVLQKCDHATKHRSTDSCTMHTHTYTQVREVRRCPTVPVVRVGYVCDAPRVPLHSRSLH